MRWRYAGEWVEDGRGCLLACRSVVVFARPANPCVGRSHQLERVRTCCCRYLLDRVLAERGLRVRAFGRGLAEAIYGEYLACCGERIDQGSSSASMSGGKQQ